MCGIVGYVGPRPAVDLLSKGLARLEYRGYDSAGIAFVEAGLSSKFGKIQVLKAEGKLDNVKRMIASTPDAAKSHCGIGHTRWATHGKPTTQNAHPHRTGHVVLVHNGIIENYQDIRKALIQRGHTPQSETDSELYGFLVLEKMEQGLGLQEAARRSFLELEGGCSVVVMSEREPGTIVGIRNGSPLVAADDPKGGAILASDAQPILEYTADVVFLNNGDLVVGTDKGVSFFDFKTGKAITRERSHLDWSADSVELQGFPHYMLKEIHEQPVALVDTLNQLVDRAKGGAFELAAQPGVDLLLGAESMTLIACGTSYHAAMLGKYWIEKYARIPVQVELASEFRYRDPVLSKNEIVVGITQSGETADTLAVLQALKGKVKARLAITNVRGSSVTREAEATFFTAAGPEIGVAATKTFISQLLVLLTWAGAIAQKRKTQSPAQIDELFQALIRLPHLLKEMLDEDSGFSKATKQVSRAVENLRGFFFIGRGFSYPIALEGALKLKEIAYIHAEGYAAGELKHGPIAMIDQGMAVVVLAPRDEWREKTISNLEEVKARGARIIGIGDASDHHLKELSDYWIPLPSLSGRSLQESLLPFLTTPVMQRLSYELAVLKGTDVDKPRNLAKSVTVE